MGVAKILQVSYVKIPLASYDPFGLENLPIRFLGVSHYCIKKLTTFSLIGLLMIHNKDIKN